MASFYTALICTNGHVTASKLERYPELSANFCKECGASNIYACPSCNALIQGQWHSGSVGYFVTAAFKMPYFCQDCGESYPWTQSALQAARDIVEGDEHLSVEEKAELAATLDDLVKESPRTLSAGQRFKRLAAKAGTESAGMLKQVLISVLSEAAKKTVGY